MGETPVHSPKTRRAGVACLSCRVRKVRCDVQVHGIPCHNCLVDTIPCRVQKKKRGRPARPRTGGENLLVELSEPGHSQEQAVLNNDLLPRFSGKALHTIQWRSPDTLDDSSDVHREEDVMEVVPSNERTASIQAIDENRLHQELSYVPLINSNAFRALDGLDERLSRTATASSYGNESSGNPWEDPETQWFIKPPPKTLEPCDLRYLQEKGALHVPPTELRNEIISSYLQFIHPQLPLLDSWMLRQIAQGWCGPTSPAMSLLLFQAVMFSAVQFIDVESIRTAGYDTPHDIRRAFYARARLLYDHDVESDRICIIQSLILMAYMSEKPGDAKGGWHWIGVAVTMMMNLGLHRKVDYARVCPEQRGLRRRIWWSCYIRDRTLALALSRPWRIRDDEFDTPMLTLADFEIHGSEEHCAEDVLLTTCTEEDIALANISIGLAQLYTRVSDILNMHFSILPEEGTPLPCSSQDETSLTSILLFARSQVLQVDRIIACDGKLQAWFDNRPPSCVYNRLQSDSQVLNSAFLNLVYSALVSALHRPILRSKTLTNFVEYRMLSERRVQNAAIETSRISRDLHELKLSQFWPGAAPFYQLPAIMVFLRELQSPNNRPTSEIFSSILPCLNVMEDVKERQSGAHIAMMLGVDLLRRSNIVFDTDNETRRISRLYYRNSRPMSNAPPAQDEVAVGGLSARLHSRTENERVNGTVDTTGNPQCSGFTDIPVCSSQDATAEYGNPQPFDLDTLSPGNGGADGNLFPRLDAFAAFIHWDLLPFSDDSWG